MYEVFSQPQLIMKILLWKSKWRRKSTCRRPRNRGNDGFNKNTS